MIINGPIDPEQFVKRACDGLDELLERGKQVGYCSNPVHLSIYDPETFGYPSFKEVPSASDFQKGDYYKRCGTRRAKLCKSCASLYKNDARTLIRHGLDEAILTENAHLAAFFTLTAPSFGKVHRATESGETCHSKKGVCIHQQSLTCSKYHQVNDDVIGQPLCDKCYDYERAVIFNALSGQLWRRTTIYLSRNLAKILGVSVTTLKSNLELNYVKVIEFQRRGVVHVHGLLRATKISDSPNLNITWEQLCLAMQMTFRSVVLNFQTRSYGFEIRWGDQFDVRVIDVHSVKKVTNYLAKYATKSSTDSWGLDHRVKSEEEIKQAKCNPHLKRLALTAYKLGSNPELESLGLSRWAHDLGHRGHFLTKSRQYSVTFTHLRELRKIWQIQNSESETTSFDMESLYWVGGGWPYRVDRQIIRAAYDELEESRRLAAEEFGKEVM